MKLIELFEEMNRRGQFNGEIVADGLEGLLKHIEESPLTVFSRTAMAGSDTSVVWMLLLWDYIRHLEKSLDDEGVSVPQIDAWFKTFVKPEILKVSNTLENNVSEGMEQSE